MILEVLPYDPNWIDEYEREKNRLVEALDGVIVEIHHIGSTSVKGLAAKPVIDIVIESGSLKKLDAVSCRFENLGYEVMGEYGI